MMDETENTSLARKHLAEVTDKPIKIVSTKELADKFGMSWVENTFGVCRENDGHILIGLNYSRPETNESAFIHEVQHIILRHEGFPTVSINEHFGKKNIQVDHIKTLIGIHNQLCSVIQHPAVYQRMAKNYNIDMEKYFERAVGQKIHWLSEREKAIKYDHEREVFFTQQDILDGLEYFYYAQKQKEVIIENFKENSSIAYHSCCSLLKKIQKIGMYSPENCRKSAVEIKKHIINYGKRKEAVYSNKFWLSLEIE